MSHLYVMVSSRTVPWRKPDVPTPLEPVMAFSAMHADAGRVDATLPDLGCGLTWDQVHKVRPRVVLRCPECGHGVHARVSSRGMRHFAHDPGRPPDCAWLNESLEHHQLKLALANAARSAGWQAELEVTGPNASWRADVLATSPDQARSIAWEAQLSPISEDDIRYRTARYEADGIEVCWVTPNSVTWLGSVPAIRVAEQAAEAVIIDGAAGFQFTRGRWQTPDRLTLTEFVQGVQDGSVVVHDVLSRYRQIKVDSTRYAWRHRLWTMAASVEAEGRHELMRQRQDAWRQRQQEAEAAQQAAERRQREDDKRRHEAEHAAEQARRQQEQAQRDEDWWRGFHARLEQDRLRQEAVEQQRRSAAEAAEHERQRLDQAEADAASRWIEKVSETRTHELHNKIIEYVWRNEMGKTATIDTDGPKKEHAYGTAIQLGTRLYGVVRPSPTSMQRLPGQLRVFVLNAREAQLLLETGKVMTEQMVHFDFPDDEQLSLL
ncbi:competence protein CoiA [Kribbella sp. NPDC056345]|uniref:competence protein CoiA n=1 Tax=Kribbella sp. NPDC056345 TaxID=3345789 RepID=UPI0035DF70A5